MPKIQSYVSSTVYRKMSDIIDNLLKDGAERHEANISALAAKLIDMGMILYELQNKESEPVANDGEQDGDNATLVIETLKRAMKAEMYSRLTLQLTLDENLKNKVGSYDDIKLSIETQVDSAVSGV